MLPRMCGKSLVILGCNLGIQFEYVLSACSDKVYHSSVWLCEVGLGLHVAVEFADGVEWNSVDLGKDGGVAQLLLPPVGHVLRWHLIQWGDDSGRGSGLGWFMVRLRVSTWSSTRCVDCSAH